MTVSGKVQPMRRAGIRVVVRGGKDLEPCVVQPLAEAPAPQNRSTAVRPDAEAGMVRTIRAPPEGMSARSVARVAADLGLQLMLRRRAVRVTVNNCTLCKCVPVVGFAELVSFCLCCGVSCLVSSGL